MKARPQSESFEQTANIDLNTVGGLASYDLDPSDYSISLNENLEI